MAFIHSREHRAALEKRRLARIIDQVEKETHMSGFDRVPSPSMKRQTEAYRAVKQQVEVRFSKHPPRSDEVGVDETDHTSEDFQNSLDEQVYAQNLYPGLNKGQALAKWYASPEGKKVLNARVKHGHRQSQLKARIGDGDLAQPTGGASGGKPFNGTGYQGGEVPPLTTETGMPARSAASGSPRAAVGVYDSGTQSPSPMDKAAISARAARVAKALIADGFPEDLVWSALHQREQAGGV